MTSSEPLLREWDLIQQDIVPSLLAGHRRPKAWSVGPVEDAVVMALALDKAGDDGSGREGPSVYSGLENLDCDESGFSFADLKQLPIERRDEWFVRRNSRWMADDRVAEQIVLGDPTGAVDLVTYRPSVGEEPELLAHVADQLDDGGQLFVIGSIPVNVPVELRPERENRAGRLFRKRSAARCKRIRPDGRHPERVTLANRRSQRDLVESHIGLARSLARRFAHRGEGIDDLEQVALMALVGAAKRFDPDRDVRFSTFAASSILGELKRHFRDKSWILRVPRSVQETYLSLKDARDELTQSLGRSPTSAELADHLKTSEGAVLDALRAADNFWPMSIDAQTEVGPTEIPVVDESFDQALDRLELQQSAPKLNDREKLLLRRIYFESCTQRQVATELGISQMQVSRLLARAFAKLRG